MMCVEALVSFLSLAWIGLSIKLFFAEVWLLRSMSDFVNRCFQSPYFSVILQGVHKRFLQVGDRVEARRFFAPYLFILLILFLLVSYVSVQKFFVDSDISLVSYIS